MKGRGVCPVLHRVTEEGFPGPCQSCDCSEGAAIWLPGGKVSKAEEVAHAKVWR